MNTTSIHATWSEDDITTILLIDGELYTIFCLVLLYLGYIFLVIKSNLNIGKHTDNKNNLTEDLVHRNAYFNHSTTDDFHLINLHLLYYIVKCI